MEAIFRRQYEFKDLFDLESIRKGFGEMLEYDIAKMINEVNGKAMKEKDTKRNKPFEKSELEQLIEKIVREVIKDEIAKIRFGSGVFGNQFTKALEYQGFERNCPTCMYNASRDYCSSGRC